MQYKKNLKNQNQNQIQNSSLKITAFETPLGLLAALSDNKALYRLAFIDKLDNLDNLNKEREQLELKKQVNITVGLTGPIESIQSELKAYFKGTLKKFKTPLHLEGTPFQKQVWNQLLKVPYGKTWSYAEQAKAMGRPKAYRAVANANGANQFVIVIPCHRIISSQGTLGGYSSGIERKEWLLEHEQKY